MKNNFLISCYALSKYSNSLLHIPEYYGTNTLKFVKSVGDGEQVDSKEEQQEQERVRQEAVRLSDMERREKYRKQEEERELVSIYLDLSNEKLCFLNTHIL